MFWEIVDTGNLFLLDKQYDPEKQYKDLQQQYISKVWTGLCDEYFKIKEDEKAQRYLQHRQEEKLLIEKIKLYASNLELLVWIDSNKKYMSVFDQGKKIEKVYRLAMDIEPKTKLKPVLGITHNFDIMEKVLKSLQTRYNLKFKKKKKILQDAVKNRYDIIALVENTLNRSLGDLSLINVKQWLAYEKAAAKKSKTDGKQHSRRNPAS